MFSCPDGAEVCNMFEKYNVVDSGSAGGGGEYDVQTGFGWTNGVVIGNKKKLVNSNRG